MAAHTSEQFNLFLSQLRETNATLDFYCDFPKIANNVAEIEISLNTLCVQPLRRFGIETRAYLM